MRALSAVFLRATTMQTDAGIRVAGFGGGDFAVAEEFLLAVTVSIFFLQYRHKK